MDALRTLLEQLKRADADRRLAGRGTREYAAAVERVDRIVAAIWEVGRGDDAESMDVGPPASLRRNAKRDRVEVREAQASPRVIRERRGHGRSPGGPRRAAVRRGTRSA